MGLLIKNINMTGKFRGTFPQVPPGPTPPPPPPPPSDQYANYTVLDLPGTGTNNSTNSSFVDSSLNVTTFTSTGYITQGSFSPYSIAAGYWSNYFDGTGDYLRTSANANFGFGSDNGTVECWVYPTTLRTQNVLWALRNSSAGIYDNMVQIDGSGYLAWSNGTAWQTATTFPISINTWTHVAWTKLSSNIYLWVNGQQVLTRTYSPSQTNRICAVGAADDGAAAFTGYISNFRVVKGTAVYTSNFTPSTTPLTAVSGTSLLTCQSNRFIDNSSNNFALTVSGNTSISSFGPFVPASTYNASTMGGSIYVGGSETKANLIGSDSDLALGTENFTVECWAYPTTLGIYDGYLSTAATGTIGVSISRDLGFVWQGSGVTPTANSYNWSAQVKENAWNHFAITRQSSTLRYFVNGVLLQTSTITTATNVTAASVVVGRRYTNFDQFYSNGYITDCRIVKGTALYTSTFTPPTSPVTAVTGTVLLLRGANGAIVDQSADTNIRIDGNARISTLISSNGSMFFDGSGDYLFMPANPNLSITSGPFTMEAWIYPTNIGVTTRQIICQDDGNGDNQNFQFRVNTDGKLNLTYWTTSIRSSAVAAPSTNSISLNAWSHVAVSYTGSTLRLFINGVQEFSGSVPSMYSNTVGTSTTIGSLRNIAFSNYFAGYMNDVRITKGIARYTANFTPPTRS